MWDSVGSICASAGVLMIRNTMIIIKIVKMLEGDLSEITNEELRQSIANITMLMDKINHSI